MIQSGSREKSDLDVQKKYNSGGRIGYETAKDARTATFSVHLDPQHPSYLELPLVPDN
ncbi:MAG: hypothetical protein JSS21_10995 [Proteobacteria bacterium]|nr:hypothetical protein [Pseudomonadota bacterium]